MKYKIRKTGEIIDVVSYSSMTSTERSEIYDWVDYIDSNGNEIRHAQLNKYWDLELVNETENDIDWEQRRYELVKETMNGLSRYKETKASLKMKAKKAIQYADALIAELKKNQPKEE